MQKSEIKIILSPQKSTLELKKQSSVEQAAFQTDCPIIEVIEVYIEKSRALGLGQRLLWHMDKFNKKLTLPYIPDSKDLYLQPLSVKIAKTSSEIQTNTLRQSQPMIYTENSNTVFYYNDYKVVLLLDFSQSTSSVYPGQTKSYVDKMRECLEVIIKNLLFQIQNQFCKQADELSLNKKENTKAQKKEKISKDNLESAIDSDTSWVESDAQRTDQHRIFAIEEQSESGINNAEDATTSKYDQQNSNDENPCVQHQRKNQNINEPKNSYFPKVYLSIVVSGLPPGNNIKLIVHNQKIDHRDLSALLKSIDTRLINIEKQLRQNIQQSQTDEDAINGQLQVHLENAQCVMDLMSPDAKPLLVFLTDCTNSLQVLNNKKQFQDSLFDSNFGQIDKSIHKLHLSDCRIISIDLQNENKTCNTLGYINHENELHYLTTITQGIHFTYKRLMEIYSNLSNFQTPQTDYLFARDGKIKFVQEDNQLIIKKQTDDEQYKVTQNNIIVSQINTLQKVMFARACNNRLFIQSDEIACLIKESNIMQDNFLIHDQMYFIDLALPQLLFQGKVVPLLQCQHLTEYCIEKVGFKSLCEFRSKMGFKFNGVKFQQNKCKITQISYAYLIDSQIQIHCILKPDPYKSAVTASYNIHAPASTLRNLNQNFNDKRVSMRDRLKVFIESLKQKDKNFQLLEQIIKVIKKVQILFQNLPPSKYKDPNRQKKNNFKGQQFEADVDNDEFSNNKKQKQKPKFMIQSEEEARAYLIENKVIWEKLVKIISFDSLMYQWKCYFRYKMITITTQSASLNKSLYLKRDPSKKEFWKHSITEEWQIESQIEEQLVEEIGNFTTLTLDNSNFIQIFEDNSTINQYKIMDIPISSLQKNEQDESRNELHFGFCLIRLNMKATNVAEVHFGFYQVGAKQRLSFCKTFKNYFNSKCQKGFSQTRKLRNKPQSQGQFPQQMQFKCFSKIICSIFIQAPKRYRFSLGYIQNQNDDSVEEHESISDEQVKSDEKEDVPKDLDRLVYNSKVNVELKQRRQQYLKSGMQLQSSQLFHRNEWCWKDNNKKTTEELYFRILQQRLQDGFKIINRLQGTTEFYHMFKVLRATKDRSVKTTTKNSETAVNSDKKNKQEKIEIVIQFLIFLEENSGQYEIHEELYMEQEISFFQLEKHQIQNSNKSSFISSSGGSYDGNTGTHSEVSCKEFFVTMADLLYQVDKSIHEQINTYHHIVKNSIHKQIQAGEFQLRQSDSFDFSNAIKEGICYFRNTMAITKRQRRDRETQICQKLQSLHHEWQQYLKNRYPELFQQSNHSDQVNIQVQQLLDVAKICGKQYLQVPRLEPQDNKISKVLCEKFMLSILATLNEFSDLKVSVDAISKETKSDVYFKLISKEILLLIQVKVIREQRNKVNEFVKFRDFDQNDKLQVEYYKFDPSMIKVTKESLLQSPIKKYFQNCENVTKNITKINSQFRFQIGKSFKSVRSSGLLNPSNEFAQIKDQIGKRDEIFFQQKKRSGSSVHFDQPGYDNRSNFVKEKNLKHKRERSFSLQDRISVESSGDDLEINQIDQAQQILLYYQQSRSREILRSQLQFETKVNVIIQNFAKYLQQNFEKVFAETIILGLRQDLDETKINQKDFQKALSTMGKITFQMDLSFAYILKTHVDKPEFQNQIYLINQASNKMFSEIVNRNFVPCSSEPSVMIYKQNAEDSNPQSSTLNSMFNLQGTPDAYSENEANQLDHEDVERPERVKHKFDQEVYKLCENLILKVEIVIRDRSGKEFLRQPAQNFSDVFDLSQKTDLLEAVQEKISQKSSKSGQNFADEFLEFKSNQEYETSDQIINENLAQVEIQMTFYTIPQYIGLLRAKDVDFLQDKTKIIINDDLEEDLIRVCKIAQIKNTEKLPQEQFQIITSGNLVFPLKKHQITKSIPYFFLIEQEQESQKIFYLEEIQRKVIFGILRRLYAMIGYNFTELLSLQRPQNVYTLILVQKYFGYLLFNQVQHHRFYMFESKFVKRFGHLQETLRSELENNSILQVGVHRDLTNPKRNLYYLTNTNYKCNFELQEEWQSVQDLYLTDETKFIIPFWTQLVIEESEKGISLNFCYYIPHFKKHYENYVEKLNFLSSELRLKVKKLVLLHEVSQKFIMTKELKLSSNIPTFDLNESISSFQGNQSQQRVSSPMLKKVAKPTMSKFASKMSKANVTSPIGKILSAQSSLNLEKQKSFVGEVILPQKQQENETDCILENFVDCQQIIQTSQCLNAEKCLVALKQSTALFSSQIDGMPNVFAFIENNQTSIMRLSANSYDQILMEFLGVYQPSHNLITRNVQYIKTIIQEATQRQIANQSLQRNLSFEEFEFIKNAEDKILLIFPIPNSISEKLALVKIFKQILIKRLLMSIKVSKKANASSGSMSGGNSFNNNFNSFSNISMVKSSFGGAVSANQSQYLMNSFVDDQPKTEEIIEDKNLEKQARLSELDTNLLYNYNMYFDKDLKTLMKSFFGQALALVQLQVLQKFNNTEFQKQSGEISQDNLLDLLQCNTQDIFEVSACMFDYKMNTICKSYRQKGLQEIVSYCTTTQDDLETTHSLPFVYSSHKVGDSFYLKEENIQLSSKLDAVQYLQVLVHVQEQSIGQFKKDLFIKQLILDFNQALFDTKIELNIYSQMAAPRQQISQDQDFTSLRILFEQTLTTHSCASKRYKFDVANLNMQKFPLSLLSQIHSFYYNEMQKHLKTIQICIKDRDSLVQAMMTFYLIVSFKDNNTMKKIVISIPTNKPFDAERITQMLEIIYFYEEISYSLIVGQFPSLQAETSENLIFENTAQNDQDKNDQQHQTENNEEMRTMETGLHQMNNLKLYTSVIQAIQMEDTKTRRYIQHRSFFMILDFNSESLVFSSYNIQREKVKELKNLVTNSISQFRNIVEKLKIKEVVSGKKKKKGVRRVKKVLKEEIREIKYIQSDPFQSFYADFFKEDPRMKRLNM